MGFCNFQKSQRQEEEKIFIFWWTEYGSKGDIFVVVETVEGKKSILICDDDGPVTAAHVSHKSRYLSVATCSINNSISMASRMFPDFSSEFNKVKTWSTLIMPVQQTKAELAKNKSYLA